VAGRRVDLGFEGGTVLRITLAEDGVTALTGALNGDSAGGWRELTAEEGSYWINVGELVYVRLAPGEVSGRIGFSGA
jgi:hypothetical protein